MTKNLNRIRPKYLRQKRWDSLGRAWKWMSGSPDADDLRLISKEINRAADNNNEQITINQNMYNDLENITNTINKLVELDNDVQKKNLNDKLFMIVFLNLDRINNEIVNIQNSILFSKIKVVNHHVLSDRELELVSKSLSTQGIAPDLLDEALNSASTTIGSNGETLHYIINIPNLNPHTYNLLRIEAISSNLHRIKLPGNTFLHGQNSLYLNLKECQPLGQWTLCHILDLKNISSEPCILNIISGKEGKCDYEIIDQQSSITQMSNSVLLLNEINDTLITTCDVDNRTLVGSYFVSYENCSVTIRNHTYSNRILETIQQPIFIPSTNLKIERKSTNPTITVHTLHALHRLNLKHLDHLKLQTSSHHCTILGGLSLTSTAIILLTLYIFIKARSQSSSITITHKNPSTDEVKSQPSTRSDLVSPIMIPMDVHTPISTLPSIQEARIFKGEQLPRNSDHRPRLFALGAPRRTEHISC